MSVLTPAQWDDITRRRFGSLHVRPCNIPSVTTCALSHCQIANECQAGKPRRRPATSKGERDA